MAGALFSRVKVWATEVLTKADLNAEFDNILNNFMPSKIDDASINETAMQATADPYPGGTASLPTTLEGELQRLRYLIKQMHQEDQWYYPPTGKTLLLRAGAGGSADAITADFTPNTALTDRMIVAVCAGAANTTTTPTFAPDGLATHIITKFGGSPLNVGDIAGAGHVIILEYNLANTRWELLNPATTASLGAFTGAIIAFPSGTEPAGWFELDGCALSIKTYESLYDIIGNDYGLNAGITFTANSGTDTFPAVAHGLSNGDIVEVTNTGGALPTGISTNLKYYIINKADDTFQLSTTPTGLAVNITNNGSGTNKVHDQFKLPDCRGYFLRGWAHGQTTDPDKATRTDRGDGTTGDIVGSKQADELKSHAHGIGSALSATSSGGSVPGASTHATVLSTSAGGNETRPVNINVLFCIKY